MNKSAGQLFNRATPGFTLIELTIAVTVVAILAALAVPAYQQDSMRTHRVEAISSLVHLASCLEAVRVSMGNYDLGQCSPAALKSYRFEVEPGSDGTGFRLSAHPNGRQSGDQCGSLQLNHLGERSISSDRQDSARCWAAR